MRKIFASITLCAATLAGSLSSANAYGPYAHAHVAVQAAHKLGLDAIATKYYVAGAILADLDKASRLKATIGSEAVTKLLQGCTGEGPITRGMTHASNSPMVAKLVAHAAPHARALGLGMRNHGTTDSYADKTAQQRIGHANSGMEDLAFDVAHARTGIAGAAAALDDALGAGLLEDATIRSWIVAASGLADDAVKTQMHGYGCFVKGFVHNKAKLIAPLLKLAVKAVYLKHCIAEHHANPLGQLMWKPAHTGGLLRNCGPIKISKLWHVLLDGHTAIVNEAIDAAVADYRAHVHP